MKFDTTALKAYVGMLLATYGAYIAAQLTDFLFAAIGLAGSVELKTAVSTLIAAAIGYVAVYFTPNKQTTP